jgi:hypothetical protein
MTEKGTEGSEPLAALLQRYRSYDDEPTEVHRASLAQALAGGEDPLKVVEYFTTLGLPVQCLDDLFQINNDPSEEELHAFRVQEGVAISVASDGVWALYTP